MTHRSQLQCSDSAAASLRDLAAQQPRAETPETVMTTLHAKPGAEADLARAIRGIGTRRG